jgi:hypothetical protein
MTTANAKILKKKIAPPAGRKLTIKTALYRANKKFDKAFAKLAK